MTGVYMCMLKKDRRKMLTYVQAGIGQKRFPCNAQNSSKFQSIGKFNLKEHKKAHSSDKTSQDKLA